MTDHTIRFQPHGSRTASRPGSTVLDLAQEAGVSIESICGGLGKCGKCRVMVTHGKERLSPISDIERRMFSGEQTGDELRLACQARIVSDGDVIVVVPEASRREHHRLVTSGIEPSIQLAPAISKVLLKIPPATLADVRADDDRLLDILNSEAAVVANIAPGVHRLVPRALREKSWEATAVLYMKEELIGIDPGDSTGDLLGVAVDVGTTKLAAYLVDLTTGTTIGTESKPNPQIPFGEDVMSRITFAANSEGGLEKLQKAVAAAVNDLICQLCEGSGRSTMDILEVVVVGNTAMHHIFFGISPSHLAMAPYAPVVRKRLSVDPGHVGIEMYPFGKVSALPNIAGFVGADAVAALMSSGLHDDDDLGMMIDIGTNTEIIAGSRKRLVGCSCASGPAFKVS